MNTAAEPVTLHIPAIGATFEGGYLAGYLNVDGKPHALIVAPKFDGEHDDITWNGNNKRVAGAQSYCNGMANTEAMVAAGSKLAQWARGLRIAGFDDWYLPSQDELEICYRAFKPTGEENALYGRSGCNASALPPTHPYAAELPAQTSADAFKEGGAEAFGDTWYWSSTQHAGDYYYAWCQYFDNGSQHGNRTDVQLRARAVRRFPL
jgi:hypothetical protein